MVVMVWGGSVFFATKQPRGRGRFVFFAHHFPRSSVQ